MWIDTHSHPLHEKYSEEPTLGIATYLAEAEQAGVGRILGVACRRSEWTPMLAATEAHANLFAITGVHPYDAAEAVSASELVNLAKHPKVVGLGETGLDYYYPDAAPRDVQAQSFHAHLEAAAETGLPVVVHTREAEADTIEILKAHKGVPFVLHCFTGTPWLAEQGLALGGYLSFSGILTFGKSAETLCEIAKHAPRERVLIETDAPYLAPAPYRGKRNASALVPHTGQLLAQLWQTSPEAVAETTTQNAKRLFTKLA